MLTGAHVSHNFSQELGDLVDAGKGATALLQVRAARVDVGALGERSIVVPRPLADDGERDARVLHQRQGRVPGVVQGDPAQARSLERPPGGRPRFLWAGGGRPLRTGRHRPRA